MGWAFLFLASILTLLPDQDRFGGASDGSAYGGSWVEDDLFAVSSELAEAVRVDFSLDPEVLLDERPEAPCSGSASLVPAQFEDGSYGCWCWGDGRWLALPCAMVGEGKPVSGRIEMRDLGDSTFVSYWVRIGEEAVTLPRREVTPGALRPTYVQLKTASGRGWFRGGARSAGEHWVRTEGAGELTSFTGFDAVVSAEGWRLKTFPGEQVTTIGAETAVTTDLVVLEETEAEPTVIGGTVRPSVALDVTRPRAGQPLVATQTSGTFLGLSLPIVFAWTRADWSGANETPVSETASYTPTAEDYAHWLAFTARDTEGELAHERLFFSKLPVCYIATEDGLFPTAEKEEHAAVVRVQGNDTFKEQYAGAASVKVRGNTSAGYPKKPYKLKLNKKATLCGLGSKKSKHWVLLANMPDMSNLRNKLAFDFANDFTGTYGMKSTWVDVVFNGRYDGVYQLAEHIRIAEDRVNVFDWEGFSEDNGHTAEDLAWIDAETTDIVGGWIFEFSNEMDEVSRFTVKSGNLSVPTMVNAPEFLNTNPTMFAAAKTYLQNYFDACTSASRRSGVGLGYAAYCDVDSMVGYFLVQELFGNQDAGAKSRYASKDLGRKLVFGPVWDFDHAAGTANMQKPSPERWHAAQNSFYAEWLSDYRFARRVRAKYRAIREAYSALASEGGTIDRDVAYLRKSAEANDVRWPQVRTFAQDVAVLKNFITRHRIWLDAQFATLETLIESTRCDSQTNPCNLADIKPEGLLFHVR